MSVLSTVSLCVVTSGIMAHSLAGMCFSIFFQCIYHMYYIFQVKWKSLEAPAMISLCFALFCLAGPPASVTPGIHTLGTCLPRMTGMCLLCATGKEGVSARFFWSEIG